MQLYGTLAVSNYYIATIDPVKDYVRYRDIEERVYDQVLDKQAVAK